LDRVQNWLTEAIDTAPGWLTSPPALSQISLLVLAYLAARYLGWRLSPVIDHAMTPKPEATHVIARLRRFALLFLPLLLPLLAYALTAVGEGLTRQIFGQGEVIAFDKRVFLALAALELVRRVLPDGFLKLLGRYVLLPVAALYALGVLNDATACLDAAQVNLGNIQFSVLSLIRGAVSGIILLLEGQPTVGDYVELAGGERGTIVKMTARACVLQTFDPNEHFITTRVFNYSDQGSANRYEALFSVSYETDIKTVPVIVEAAVAKLPFVLQSPDGPDCELRGSGESSVDFADENWVAGIDDGKNKYGSPVLFAIWNALKEAGIEMPYPCRVVELRRQPA